MILVYNSSGQKEMCNGFMLYSRLLLRSREEVMEKVVRQEEEERPIILSIRYDRGLPKFSAILQQPYKLLVERSPSVKEFMARAPMVAYQRPPNLRDMLVRAKLPPVDRRRGAGRSSRSAPQRP